MLFFPIQGTHYTPTPYLVTTHPSRRPSPSQSAIKRPTPAQLDAPPKNQYSRHSSILSSVSLVSGSRPKSPTTPSIASTSPAPIFLPPPLHSPSLTAPCSSNSKPLVRCKCRRVCDSIYRLLSSRLLSQSIFATADGRVWIRGRKAESRERSDGSCESAKLTCVVSGACEDVPTPRAFAEGFEVRNERVGGFGVGIGLVASDSSSSFLVSGDAAEVRRERS